MMIRCASLFSGGGGWEVGAMRAGLVPTWGVECDVDIAGVYARNIGEHVTVAPAERVDYTRWPAVDVLFASPECTRASNANQNGSESGDDRRQADAVVAALEALRPRYFFLENVWLYRRFEAFRRIMRALNRLGYGFVYEHVNCADHGVPQTRKRLILRAERGAVLMPSLPAPMRWVGWYEAIEDLIPSLPESEFADWQLERLLDMFIGKFLQMTGATSKGRLRAFVVDGQTCSGGEKLTIRTDGEPIYTVSASIEKRPARAWLDQGRVVKMTPRALARFQSFPDSYELPASRTLASTVIGNAVPPLLARRLVEVTLP